MYIRMYVEFPMENFHGSLLGGDFQGVNCEGVHEFVRMPHKTMRIQV